MMTISPPPTDVEFKLTVPFLPSSANKYKFSKFFLRVRQNKQGESAIVRNKADKRMLFF